jgi:ribosomal protein S18 acetylase RimI-like enzyme
MDARRAHGNTSALAIRRATTADAEQLSAFAAAVFRAAFAAQNTPEDMDAYVAGAFSPARQAAEIAAPSADVLLLEAADALPDAALRGYAHLAITPPPACVTGPAPIELKRFYIAGSEHGRGAAAALMGAVLAAAGARDARTLWLGVFESNARAIAFYRRHGFGRAGEQTFLLGSDVQRDWVMAREVA